MADILGPMGVPPPNHYLPQPSYTARATYVNKRTVDIPLNSKDKAKHTTTWRTPRVILTDQ